MKSVSTLPGTVAGNIAVPQLGEIAATPHPKIDVAVADVAARRRAWGALDVASRIDMLGRLIADTAGVARRWAQAECERKGIPSGSPVSGEEWAVGPWCTLSYMRHLRATLQDIERHGRPRLPGPVRSDDAGGVSARIFPRDPYDRVQYMGLIGEVWMAPGVGADEVWATVGGVYRADGPREARVGAILGAGNISSIPVLDVVHKMFAEDQVVVLKLNPITDPLGPIFEEALRALIEGGYLRIVHGGAEEAQHLVHHDAVQAVHMTGSDKTHDAIVFGAGPDGAARKAANRPLLDKPITSELGNVTPVIVVPGDWSQSDIDFQARMIASGMAHGGGYECITPRLLVTPARWSGREQFLGALRRALREIQNRVAFYPGASARFSLFTDAHPGTELLGAGPPGSLPWALIAGVAPDTDDLVFTTDPFAPVVAETPLEGASASEFIDRAVRFCNERVWGTLAAAVIVHPRTLRAPRTAATFRRAIADLRYGTISVNGPTMYGFGLTSTPWGAFPGHEASDIRSGRGVVHNSYLLERTEKTVFRGPFRIRPKPSWWPTHAHSADVFARLVDLEAAPSAARLSWVVHYGMRG